MEKKRVLCELAKEHAGQATAAAEQSRTLLSQAAAEISRLESENHSLQQQVIYYRYFIFKLAFWYFKNCFDTLSKYISLKFLLSIRVIAY